MLNSGFFPIIAFLCSTLQNPLFRSFPVWTETEEFHRWYWPTVFLNCKVNQMARRRTATFILKLFHAYFMFDLKGATLEYRELYLIWCVKRLKPTHVTGSWASATHKRDSSNHVQMGQRYTIINQFVSISLLFSICLYVSQTINISCSFGGVNLSEPVLIQTAAWF